MAILSIVTHPDSDCDCSLHQAQDHKQGEQFPAGGSRTEPGEDVGRGGREGDVLEAVGYQDWGDGGEG